jgi:cell division septal protein FtsQ
MERPRPAPSARPTPAEPPRASSRLTLAKKGNRRRATPLWSRMPRPRQLLDGCGRALRRAVPAMIGLVAVGAVAGGGYGGYRFVTHSPRFAITDIEVRGTHVLAPDAIRARLGFVAGDNIFLAPLARAERTLGAEPWIADVRVHRELPHTVVVDVRERAPAAVVELDGLYLADAAGRVFKRAATEHGEGAGLPVVTGLDRAVYGADPDAGAAEVARALAALTAWRAAGTARPEVGEVHVDRRGGLTFFTYDGAVAIRIGDADGTTLTARLHTFDRAWAALRPDERARARAVHVDNLTRPDHVTVAFDPSTGSGQSEL